MEILGILEQNEELAEELQERVDLVVHKLKFFPDKLKMIILENLNPVKSAVNETLKDMMTKAGGSYYDVQIWDEVLDLDPDVIILSFPEESLESSLGKSSGIFQKEGFSNLKAVKENKVFIFDNRFLHTSVAQEKVDVLEALAEIITPKYFSFGLDGQVWIKLGI